MKNVNELMVPSELDIINLYQLPWVDLKKGKGSTVHHGYGPDDFKIFVQPQYNDNGHHLKLINRALNVINNEKDITAKFLNASLRQEWQKPEQEKLVVYSNSGKQLKYLTDSLNEEFGIDAYLYGSAPGLTWGRYSDDYGAGYTHQINPMIHTRRGGRDLHRQLINITKRENKLHYEDLIKKYLSIDNPTQKQVYEELKNLLTPNQIRRSYINQSLENVGILEMTVHSSDGNLLHYILDPRKKYEIGRPSSTATPDIKLTSPYSSRQHATIQFYPEHGDYGIINHSSNGTQIKGSERMENGLYKLKNGTYLKFSEKDTASVRTYRI